MRTFALTLALVTSAAAAQGYVRVQDEGTNISQRQKVNFVGAGVSCADNAGNASSDCTIVSAGTPAYATIQEEGTPLTARVILNFVGGNLTCADDGSSKTVCTLSITASNGGTGQSAAPADDQVLVGNGSTYELKTLPSCSPGVGIAYVASSNTFVCDGVPSLPRPATLAAKTNPLLLPCNAVRRTNCR